jgi:hypothetical protein
MLSWVRNLYLPDERWKIGMFEVEGEQFWAKEGLVDDLEGLSVVQPADDVLVLGVG